MAGGVGSFDYTTDVQRLVDDLRDWLTGVDQTVTTEVVAMVEAYGTLCRELNDRLRRCQEFLRLNLWSAAIQLAEIEPNLVDRFTHLDFDSRSELDDRVAMYEQLGTVPTLLNDIYDELNEAYEYHMPLERLFAKHRRLALKRSPLSSRLRVARTLADRDERSLFWEDDVIAFERGLISEIKDEARKASSRGDAQALQELKQMLESPDWFELPSAKLIGGVKALITKAKQQQSREKLPELTESIRSHWEYWGRSFQEMDSLALGQDPNWQALSGMITKWFDDAESIGLLDSDPLFLVVAPIDEAVRALGESNQQAEAQSAAVERLQAALHDPGADRSRLRSLHSEASQWGILPRRLTDEYERGMKSLWWKANWERVLGIGLFLAAVIGAIVFAIVASF